MTDTVKPRRPQSFPLSAVEEDRAFAQAAAPSQVLVREPGKPLRRPTDEELAEILARTNAKEPHMTRPEWIYSIDINDFRWLTAKPIHFMQLSAADGLVILTRQDGDTRRFPMDFLRSNGYVEEATKIGMPPSLVGLTSMGALAMQRLKAIDEWDANTPAEPPPFIELEYMGTDASRWAASFNAMAEHLGYSKMDEGWLIGWFANAIERAKQSVTRPDPLRRLQAFLSMAKKEADRQIRDIRSRQSRRPSRLQLEGESFYDKGKIAAYGYVQQWIEEEQAAADAILAGFDATVARYKDPILDASASAMDRLKKQYGRAKQLPLDAYFAIKDAVRALAKDGAVVAITEPGEYATLDGHWDISEIVDAIAGALEARNLVIVRKTLTDEDCITKAPSEAECNTQTQSTDFEAGGKARTADPYIRRIEDIRRAKDDASPAVFPIGSSDAAKGPFRVSAEDPAQTGAISTSGPADRSPYPPAAKVVHASIPFVRAKLLSGRRLHIGRLHIVAFERDNVIAVDPVDGSIKRLDALRVQLEVDGVLVTGKRP